MSHLHILCFGASLVEGHTANGTRYTPYSRRLAELLRQRQQQRIPRRENEEEADVVDTDGRSGELVTAGFEGRMRARSMGSHPTRVLCFGDSLTEGYTQAGTVWAPYGDALVEAINPMLRMSGRRGVEVVEDGLSGDLVTGSFASRMRERYDVKSTRSPLYDWVLLLGGTNDIGWGKPVQVIHDALVRVSDIPLSKGAKVLLFTVPETAYKSPAFDAKRDELNRLIKADSRDGVFVFDLHAKIPYHSMDEKERKEIWDDRLHLTSKGYERMGELVAERLFELLDAE